MRKTELWLSLAGIVAIVLLATVPTEPMKATDAALYIMGIAGGYSISRGIAKAGTGQ